MPLRLHMDAPPPWAGSDDVLAVEPGAFARAVREASARHQRRGATSHHDVSQATLDARAAEHVNALAGSTVQTGRAIAVLSVNGPLMQRASVYDDGWWSSAYDGYDAIRARFEKALADPTVGAVALRINSPGGMCAGMLEAVDAMQRAKAAAKKPVFAYADESIYSAAYALACVADGIYLPRSGGVGSVGVITTLADTSKAMEQMGVNVVVVRSGEQKGDPHPDLPLTPEVIARVQAKVDAIAGMFAGLVAKARKLTPKAVLAFEGATFMGQDAVDAGLADGVLSFDDFLALVATKTTTTPRGAAARSETKSMNTIAKALGLKEDASEAECLAALNQQKHTASNVEQRVLQATGASSLDAALGTIAGWKSGSEQLKTAQAQLTELSGQVEAREREALIEQGVRDNKLTPGLKAWAATQPVESLKAFLSSAPKVPGFRTIPPPPGAGGGEGASAGHGNALELNGKRWEDLKAMEKHELYKSNRALYDALHADHQRRTGA